MEDDLKKNKMEDDLRKKEKMEDDLKFRGKPFLGLAQLSKIFFPFISIISWPQS